MEFFEQDTGALSCERHVASHTTHISNDRAAVAFSSSSFTLRSQQRATGNTSASSMELCYDGRATSGQASKKGRKAAL
ncbi:MAG TPA: hypothetical protein VH591_08345 [Ktedonobacterales bacterium]